MLIRESLPSRECGLKSARWTISMDRFTVTPFAGVWIEILMRQILLSPECVTPFAGVWIEISLHLQQFKIFFVTPFAGVWIEMRYHLPCYCRRNVTPFAGVWIEIMLICPGMFLPSSLPSRECGLKSGGTFG